MVNNLSKNNIDSNSKFTINILLVDDGRVVREKLKLILRSEQDIKVVGTAADGYTAIEQLEYLHPDIVLLDLDMPNLDGIATAKIIDRKYPQIKVIILTSHDSKTQINDSGCACIKEYIIKDSVDLKIADRIRSVYNLDRENLSYDNVVEFNRSALVNVPEKSQLTNTPPNTDIESDSLDRFSAISNTTFSKLNDWSNSAKELINMMPLPWTRGLLYLLVMSLVIAIPWAFLFKMDEIGTARGRLEFKGNTIKLESDLDGSVAVVKVYPKKGDFVKAGQIIMELDSKNIREQIYQNRLKLDGQQQRLNQLILMKNQMGLGTSAQQQQNQAQLLEKQSQIAQAEQSIYTLESNAKSQNAEKLAQLNQAQQTLIDRQSSYNLQKAEKLTQVRQAEQGVVDAQTNYILTQNRLKDAQNESRRYRQLYNTGAIAEIKVKEVDSIMMERNQLLTQSLATLQQSKLRVKEQQENYQKLLQQTQSDIAQAKLKLKEQQENYQGAIERTKADIAQAKLRFTEQQRGSQSLTKVGDVAVLKTDQQSKEIESQIVNLKSEIERDRAQNYFLIKQLDKYTIKANVDGTIFELPIEREGSVVQPKQLIAEIGSNASGLVFKGQIPATESESLRSSSDRKDVKLKFDEFPFESYDIVKGKLAWIAPNSKLTQTAAAPIASYDIEVQLSQSCIKHDGKCIPFKSGQPATAEIIIRNRRIIDFILDPFKKLS